MPLVSTNMNYINTSFTDASYVNMSENMNEFFLPSIHDLPISVTAFTLLRHGKMQRNRLNYPEITCCLPLAENGSSGEIASKLTAALSIHIDSFLGLSTTNLSDLLDKVQITARFSHLLNNEEVNREIKLKASDIIDTLIGLS